MTQLKLNNHSHTMPSIYVTIGAKFKLLFHRGITLTCFLFFLVVCVSSFVTSTSQFDSPLKMIAAVTAALGVLILSFYFINHYFTQSQFLFILLFGALVIRVIWILWIPTEPVSDFSYMHTAAVQAAAGDFSFAESEYFISWAYQLGFTMYEAGIIRLFGDSLLALKLMNVLFSVGTVLIVYLCATHVFNESTGRVAGLIYAFYVPNIIMCSVLTNQHLSTFFFMLACLLFLMKGQITKYSWILIGLSLGIGHVIRPMGSIFLIGIVIFAVMYPLLSLGKTIGKKQIGSLGIRMVGILVVFYLFQSLVSYSFINAGITKHPLSNQEPNWKFMVGLNAKTNGSWSMEDAQYAVKYKLGEERNQAEKEVIMERLADKSALLALFAKKIIIFWGSLDYSSMWSLSEMNKPDLMDFLNKYERMIYMAMSVFGVISLYNLLRGIHSYEFVLFVLLLLGYAAIHVVIEIQPRYRLDLMPAFIILQSYGLFRIGERVKSYFVKEPISVPT